MAENYEYMPLLQQMLAQVPDTLDKREGSVIYWTLSPAAYMLAQQNYMLGYLTNLLFADTATGEWLDRVVNDFGITRDPATYALRKITTRDSSGNLLAVALGSRFAANEVSFRLTARIDVGIYQATCEMAGAQGNQYGGAILPVDNINGLGSAELSAEPLIPAVDTETDEALRERFYLSVREIAYGGNIADYTGKVLGIEGVGAVKVFTAMTQGPGNVGLVIGDEQGNRATQTLIGKVQELMGEDGDGIAPIGHTVHVTTSTDLTVNVSAQIRIRQGYSFATVQAVATQTIKDYIDDIGFNDETVFYAKLVAAILNSHEAVMDVGTVTLNGNAGNIGLVKQFSNYQVPIVGSVTVSEV